LEASLDLMGLSQPPNSWKRKWHLFHVRSLSNRMQKVI
jgi:hypothetical protein